MWINLKSQKVIEELDPVVFVEWVNTWLGYYDCGFGEDDNDITDISFLRKCGKMENLYIYCTRITNLPLENAFKLKFIQIDGCKTLQHLNALKSCSELEEIHIRGLNITSITAIGKLKNVKTIIIDKCKQITDFNTLEECTGLTDLRIHETNIQDISPITNLKSLESLGLRDNNQLPKQFQKDIKDNKQEVQKFLDEYKQTQQYKDYQKKAPSKQEVTLQQLVPNAPTIEEQVKELQDQLQEERQQRLQNEQNQDQQMQNIQQQIQKMTQQISNLITQVQQNQTNQNHINDQINIFLQQLLINQANDKQEFQQQIISIVHKLQEDE